MLTVDRRKVVAGMGALSAFTVLPRARASSAKIVIIGGGPGGATVANHLKRSAPSLSVTLVEPHADYTSCFFSNHYITGLRSFESITHSYDGLKALGVDVAQTAATGIDTAKKSVQLADGSTLTYDFLVVAPGIDFKFDGVEGYSQEAAEKMPHAWRGGPQSRLLHDQLVAMEDGGTVLIAPPKNAYRCPPGPYERACMIAHYLKTNKPRSKVIIADPKLSFSKQPVFMEAFQKYYKDIIEVHLSDDIDDYALAKVDVKSGTVTTKAGLTIKASVANIIPEQRAGTIAAKAGLTEGDWCPVKPENFESAKAADVYVVGDASIAAVMPKSAYSANNQGHLIAQNILAKATGSKQPEPRYHNTCWSYLAPDDSVKIGADYAPGKLGSKRGLLANDPFVSHPGESAELRKTNYQESVAWYDTLVADIFANKR